nr:MAG TPA: PHAX RNA-binding domain [Caudoviricetes sp.]
MVVHDRPRAPGGIFLAAPSRPIPRSPPFFCVRRI